MENHDPSGGTVPGLLRVIDGAAIVVERSLLALAGTAIIAMMAVITISSLGRYAFNSPITGSEVWVEVFLAPLATYLALASALTHRSHVGVALLVQRSGRVFRRWTQIAGAWIVCATFAALSWQGGLRTWEAYTSGQIDSEIGVPLWLAYVVVPIGCLAIALRAALLALGWLFSGQWRIGLAQQEATSTDTSQNQRADHTTPDQAGDR